MNILENSLIRKYFGCAQCQAGQIFMCTRACAEATAFRVFEAMQRAIKNSERYVLVNRDGSCEEYSLNWANKWDGFHPNYLRLPDEFQPKKEHEHYFECKCGAFKWHGITQLPEHPKDVWATGDPVNERKDCPSVGHDLNYPCTLCGYKRT